MTRRKEEFSPLKENRVSMYSCGPTLCGELDLGQCRRLLFSDLLRRYLEFKGYQITHIINLTDLDDRTIEGASKAGVSLKEYTERYYQTFQRDLDRLLIKKATDYPRASDYVEDMIGLTGKLLEKGFAYEKFRSIYFDIARFRNYGRLSRIDLDKIKFGKTVELDQYEKDNPKDFTLLKRSTLGELKSGIFYQTRWGNVRPGWHLECAAIALKLLGPTYDIHTSGVELIFPHHENAVAISHAITDRPLANYWIHNELVLVDGKKAAQNSSDGVLTLNELIQQGFSGREVRHWLLSHHYRKAVAFSLASLEAAKNTLGHVDAFVRKLHSSPLGPVDPDVDQLIYNLKHQFAASMDDDLNIAPALASLFQFTHPINKMMDRKGLAASDREKIFKCLEQVNGVLGTMDLRPKDVDAPLKELIRKREEARKARDWVAADRLRQELKEKGIEVTDTKEGTLWRSLNP